MSKEGVQLQAARVLDNIRTLENQYGRLIVEQDPKLSEALKEVDRALDRYVNGPAGSDEQNR